MFRRQIPLALCFIMGVTMMIHFFIKHPFVQSDMLNEASNFATVIGLFAMFLGIYSLTRVHWMKIRHRRSDWFFSYLLFAALLNMAILGNLIGTGADTPFQWFYDAFMVPLQSTTFSLLSFYMASASYRAFRAKNFEATVLLIAAIIVMFGRVDVGPWLLPDTSVGNIPVPGVNELSNWLLFVPNNAASRGIFLGIGLGSIATAFKMILGIERTYLG
ncbi:MAG: hypothetical protein DRP90_05000 [Planctomycetota bacterium]|nr:MAG: hypothetical protein DRP90_05000 [Planctomycetota bacterium]